MNNTEHKSPWNSDAATAGKLAPKWFDNAVFRALGFMAGKLFALAAGLLALLTLGLIRGVAEADFKAPDNDGWAGETTSESDERERWAGRGRNF
ncbi:MAG: hypothetical protein AB7D06_17980 [Pedobacter sp.]